MMKAEGSLLKDGIYRNAIVYHMMENVGQRLLDRVYVILRIPKLYLTILCHHIRYP